MENIKQELSSLTNDFTEKAPAVRCWTEPEKDEAVKIFKQYYKIVEVSDGRRSNNDEMSWVIACSNPIDKIQESFLCEDDDLDLSEFDDPDDDMDLSDENLDTIDDISEVDKSNKITILKKKAADLAEKWKDVFKEISTLANAMDLTAVHDDDLNIELKKSDGTESDFEGDIKKIKDEIAGDEEEFDDDFGPSEYDDRLKNLPMDEPIDNSYGESLNSPHNAVLTEANYPWNANQGTINLQNNTQVMSDPNELPIREDEIDDDF